MSGEGNRFKGCRRRPLVSSPLYSTGIRSRLEYSSPPQELLRAGVARDAPAHYVTNRSPLSLVNYHMSRQDPSFIDSSTMADTNVSKETMVMSSLARASRGTCRRTSIVELALKGQRAAHYGYTRSVNRSTVQDKLPIVQDTTSHEK